jgi:hypothetical protein
MVCIRPIDYLSVWQALSGQQRSPDAITEGTASPSTLGSSWFGSTARARSPIGVRALAQKLAPVHIAINIVCDLPRVQRGRCTDH